MQPAAVVFATCATVHSQDEAVLLAASLRAFGGELALAPFRVYFPQGPDAPGPRVAARLRELDVAVEHMEPPDGPPAPFAFKVAAMARAEAEASTDQMVWLEADTLVIRPPLPLVLAQDKALGCRPVHHLLIGPRWDAPLDRFWRLVYDRCGVDESRLWPMVTCADRVKVRPYPNAGCLTVRPGLGLLGEWHQLFRAAACDDAFAPYLDPAGQHALFLHQAVLAGVVSARLSCHEVEVFPETVNYPVHLHEETAAEARLGCLNDAITARYEDLRADGGHLGSMRVNEPLRSLLERERGAPSDSL